MKTKTEKVLNFSQEVLDTIEWNVGNNVTLHVHTQGLQFNYHGMLNLVVAGMDIEDGYLFMVCRPGGPEVNFELASVSKIYFGPSRELSIYIK